MLTFLLAVIAIIGVVWLAVVARWFRWTLVAFGLVAPVLAQQPPQRSSKTAPDSIAALLKSPLAAGHEPCSATQLEPGAQPGRVLPGGTSDRQVSTFGYPPRANFGGVPLEWSQL